MSITAIKPTLEGMSIEELRKAGNEFFQRAQEIKDGAARLGRPMNAEEIGVVQAALGDLDQVEAVLAKREGERQQFERINQRLDGARGRFGVATGNQAVAGGGMTHAQPGATGNQAGVEGLTFGGKSFGQLITESKAYRDVYTPGLMASETLAAPGMAFEANGLLERRWIERKLLIQGGSETSGGAFVNPQYLPGLQVPILQRQLTILDLITRLTTNSDVVSYVKEDTFTNNAAFTAEATAASGTSGTKPETDLAYSAATSTVKTLAHWIPVTNRMLADYPQMRGIIDSRLMLGLDLTLESQIISGNGSGENLTGITGASGINTVNGAGGNNSADQLFVAATICEVSGKVMPNAIAIAPANYQTIRLAREVTTTASGYPGGYLLGPPSQIGTTTLWGIPLVKSQGLPSNTAIVTDWSPTVMALYDREVAQIRVGYINDQFTRNMTTVLAELRCAFVIWRGAAIAKVTGMP